MLCVISLQSKNLQTNDNTKKQRHNNTNTYLHHLHRIAPDRVHFFKFQASTFSSFHSFFQVSTNFKCLSVYEMSVSITQPQIPL